MITFDKITGFYVETLNADKRPEHNGRFDSFNAAHEAAQDGDHIHIICGRQSREPSRCMCDKIPAATNILHSDEYMRCEYCGCL